MSSRNSKKVSVIDLNKPHTCDFCKKSFALETTLLSHVCEPKRRHQSQNTPYVKTAYTAYKIVWKELNPRQVHHTPTYQEFCVSEMWPTLVRFASWCEEQLVQEFEQFVKYLTKQNVKMVAWCDVRVYEQFIQDLLITESAEQALCRSLMCVHVWHEHSQQPYSEFFAHVNTNQLLRWIQQGRISAWLLYNSVSAEAFFVRCSPEQLHMIQETYPITKWKVKFMRMQSHMQVIKSTLQEAGL